MENPLYVPEARQPPSAEKNQGSGGKVLTLKRSLINFNGNQGGPVPQMPGLGAP